MNGNPQRHIIDFDSLRTIYRYLSFCVTLYAEYSDTVINCPCTVDDNITPSLPVTFRKI